MRKITVIQGEKAFDRAAAEAIVAQIRKKPDSVIGLSTGRTTGNLHREVVSIMSENPFDVSRVTFYGQDEIAGVPRDYSGACYAMLKTEIIDGLGIPDDRFLMIPTFSDDFGRDCKAFAREIERRGGTDLLILGLGENGHLGFNQPGTPFGSEARLAGMNPELEERVRRELRLPEDHFLGGATLGLKDIMHAKKIILVAKGTGKAGIVRDIICGPVTEALPGSVLQLHPDCEYLLDDKAASLLK